MNLIDITQFDDTKQLPFTKGTLEFMQLSHKETVGGIIRGIIGSTYSNTRVYRLWGGAISVGAGLVTITEGQFFLDGEVFYCPGNSSPTGSTGVLGVDITYYSIYADPTVLTDGSSVNVHDQRRIKIYGSSVTPPTVYYALSAVSDVKTTGVSNLTSTSSTVALGFQKQEIVYNQYASSGTITITLSSTYAVVGVKSQIVFNTGYTNDYTITTGASQVIVKSGNFTGVATNLGGCAVLEVTYIGNNGTNDIFIANMLTT
jgi:hypothetical protein